jgi:hypothetical protein
VDWTAQVAVFITARKAAQFLKAHDPSSQTSSAF